MNRQTLLAKSLFALLLITGTFSFTGCSVQSISGPDFDATEEAMMVPQGQLQTGGESLEPNREVLPDGDEESNGNGGTTGRPRILHNRSDK